MQKSTLFATLFMCLAFAATAAHADVELEKAQVIDSCERNMLVNADYDCACFGELFPALRAQFPEKTVNTLSSELVLQHGEACFDPAGSAAHITKRCQDTYPATAGPTGRDPKGMGVEPYCQCVGEKTAAAGPYPKTGLLSQARTAAFLACDALSSYP